MTGAIASVGRFEWEKAIFTAGIGQGSTLAVAAAMAMYSDAATGRRIFPGVKRLAEGLGLSDRTVQKAIEALEGDGYIKKVRGHNPGKGLATEWALTLPATADTGVEYVADTGVRYPSGEEPIPDTGVTQSPDTGDAIGDTSDAIGDTGVRSSTIYQPFINSDINHSPDQADNRRSGYLGRSRDGSGDEPYRPPWGRS